MTKIDIKSMTLSELITYMEGIGEKAFRAKQIYQWIHEKQVDTFDEMTNVSKKLKETLQEQTYLTALKKEEVQESKIDGTRKYLFLLEDGNVIESVLMRYKHGNSVCISSQVGCRMGCRFCASTLDGLVRGLTAGEMLDQIYQIGKDIGERISNVVVMGTGEPLDNYDNLLKFIELLTDENGINLSQRNLTVSTCGIVPKMKELADKEFAITLALSLHASNQAKRLSLMPVANKYDIHEVIDACKYYFEKTHPNTVVDALKYVFIPKVSIRQKLKANPPETIFEFRERLREHLDVCEIKIVEIDYDSNRIQEFEDDCKRNECSVEFPKNPTRLCNWCSYQKYCESDGKEDWMIVE